MNIELDENNYDENGLQPVYQPSWCIKPKSLEICQ